LNVFAESEQIVLLGTALAIGLLIGVEWGWKSRDAREGECIAGLRTYGLAGLLGGGGELLVEYLRALVPGGRSLAPGVLLSLGVAAGAGLLTVWWM